MFYLWGFIFFVCACFPTAPSDSKKRRPFCFDKQISELQLVQADASQFENCQLYDYARIFPLMEQESCDYWKKHYGSSPRIHFSGVFLKGIRKIVCLKQEYLKRPGLSF